MKPSGFASKWTEGIFLALIDKTNEYIVGTPAGVIKTQSVKRLTRAEAKDPMLFNAVVGTPWNPHPNSGVSEIPLKRMVIRAAAAPRAELPPTVPREGIHGEFRAVYIRADVELVKYGFTDGCKGCEAASAGTAPRNHSDVCRGRIVEAMRADPELQHRVEAAEVRLTEGGIPESESPQGMVESPQQHSQSSGSSATNTRMDVEARGDRTESDRDIPVD